MTAEAGKGRVKGKPLWHTTSISKRIVSTAPYGTAARTHELPVADEKDAITVARLAKKQNQTVFLTHVVETHYHLYEDR